MTAAALMLARRREAARRMAPLPNGVVDPWMADHRDWQDRHDIEMARLGLAPEWQVARARAAWDRGVR